MPPTVTKTTNSKPVPTTRNPAKPHREASATKTPRPADDPWSASEVMRVLVYGQSGTGKTTLAATFPGPILWLLSSGCENSGELKSIDTPEYRAKVTPVNVTSSAQFEEEMGRAGDFATVVQDHGTGLQDVVLAEVQGWDKPRAQRPIIGGNKQVWGEVASKSKELYRKLFGLRVNVVLVAQERTFTSDEEAADQEVIKPVVGAAFTPAVAGWVYQEIDYAVQTYKVQKTKRLVTKVGDKEHVTYQATKGVEYRLRTEPHGVYYTKFRVPRGRPLPEYILDPDYDKIRAVIRGEAEGGQEA